jgi:hypothetical protein
MKRAALVVLSLATLCGCTTYTLVVATGDIAAAEIIQKSDLRQKVESKAACRGRADDSSQIIAHRAIHNLRKGECFDLNLSIVGIRIGPAVWPWTERQLWCGAFRHGLCKSYPLLLPVVLRPDATQLSLLEGFGRNLAEREGFEPCRAFFSSVSPVLWRWHVPRFR